MLNIGIIGAGKIADLHAPGYLSNPDARIYSVADTGSGIAESRAAEWRAEKAYTDYRAMLDDPAVDAVEVLTPHSMHAQMVIDALDAGKHVSLQKPMAVTLAECDAIVTADEKSNRLLRVFENFACYEPIVKAKCMLDEGVIGEPVSMRMKTVNGHRKHGWDIPDESIAWRFDQAINGGGKAILDYGYHIFAMARWFLGEPEQVFAWIRKTYTDQGFENDSPLLVSWSYEGGMTHGSWEQHGSNDMVVRSDYYPGDEWFELSGTRGIIWVNRCTAKMLYDTPPLVAYVDGEMRRIGEDEINADWGDSFKQCTYEFIKCIIEGGQPNMSAQDSRETYKFARASQLAAKENRPATLNEVRD
jgi:predicted dehydrogenase